MKKAKTSIPKTDALIILRHWRQVGFDDRLAHLIKDATRALLRTMQVRLIQYGVSIGHWTFLRILWETDGITQRVLSAEAGVMEPTTYAAMMAMEKLGYITRKRHPENKKNNYIYLTPAGRALKNKLIPLAEEVNAVGVSGVNARDIETTRRVLLAIIENLAKDEIGFEREGRQMPSTRELGRLVSKSDRQKKL